MGYLILSESNTGNLETAVESKLSDGWELYGFPWHGEDDHSWYYYQAIIKKTPNTKENLQNDTQQTKVQIVELVSQLEDAVAESNRTASTKLVTKLKYSAQQL